MYNSVHNYIVSNDSSYAWYSQKYIYIYIYIYIVHKLKIGGCRGISLVGYKWKRSFAFDGKLIHVTLEH